MSKREHRLGVSEATLVTRTLKLKPHESWRMEAAIAQVDNLFGMDKAFYDDELSQLRLAYDAQRLCIDDVEKVLERHGVDISSGRWNRIKEEYYRFVDQNVKDNAKQKPWSCH
ncbi:hypothetical protein [Halomonas saccharevitans]|uniref:Uncharacterized protein n=1 Tax=Halomonas saccharevitans TaxID=416872 RepID=A0A1I6X9U5_9GAMM|nr:hypothetical protein [Halomonas saccharevitans]SFT35057.1 hypothetical protein SAMN04487956_1028 [Halomonas saccharevitans]